MWAVFTCAVFVVVRRAAREVREPLGEGVARARHAGGTLGCLVIWRSPEGGGFTGMTANGDSQGNEREKRGNGVPLGRAFVGIFRLPFPWYSKSVAEGGGPVLGGVRRGGAPPAPFPMFLSHSSTIK